MMKFKKTQLSIALTGAFFSSALSLDAMAQVAAAPPKADDADKVETIVVQGYRAAAVKALDNKLLANSIMDSIVADDIGKLPAQNIAEAIGRMPGVTIVRKQGEGQFVDVRGLGTNSSAALLNGRILATENIGRAYSFDILPAELISGVDVYKSPTAALVEGGIGASINMITAQPLNLGNRIAFSVQGNHDAQRGGVSPQVTALYSMKSSDGVFGALLAFSHINRKIEGRRIFTDGFEANQTVAGVGGVQLTGVSLPTWTQYDINATTRERNSGLVTLQWRPSSAVKITADGLYSKLDVNDDSKGFFAGSCPGCGLRDAVVDGTNTVTSFTGGWGSGLIAFSRPRLAETKALGLNVEWTVSPQFSSVFDIAGSKATDRNGGNQNWFEVAHNAPGFSTSTFQYRLSPDNLPTYTNLGNISDTSNATFNGHVYEGRSVEDEVKQATYTGKFKLAAGPVKSFDFGLNYSDRKKSKSRFDTPGLWGLYSGIPVPQSVFTTASGSANLFGTGMFGSGFPAFDSGALRDYLLSDAAINLTANPAATRDWLSRHGGGFGVEQLARESGSAQEKTSGGFLQANFEGELLKRDWSANVGLRYARTETTSRGIGQEILRIDPPPPGGGENVVVVSDPRPLTVTGAYAEWLPSANFKIDLSDNLLLQASASKTLTRASLDDLVVSRTINARDRERRITDGNPGLQPMLANNADLALTWYDRKGSYVSGALFSKKLTNLTQRQTNKVIVAGLEFDQERPENVGTDDFSGYEIGGQYLFSAVPAPFNGLGVQGNVTRIVKKKISTYNVAVFYEKGPVQARLAYVYRNGYRENDAGKRGQPEDVAAYGDLSANFSFAINKNVTIFAEAMNLTDEVIHSYSIYPQRLINYESYGRRYGVGARVIF
jgi:iron complex outermembrane receptor protein